MKILSQVLAIALRHKWPLAGALTSMTGATSAYLTLPWLFGNAVDEIARLADRLVLLQNGRLKAQGALFDVMADPAAVPLLGVREAGAVLEADVIAHAEDGLSTLAVRAGQLELPGVQAPIGTRVRLRVLAQDVILSRARPEGLSSVNILPVRVEAVHPGDGPGAAIALDAGGDRLLARVTARAVRDLDLRAGMSCYAILKATTGIRVDEEEERVGLDVSEHGMEAYGGLSTTHS